MATLLLCLMASLGDYIFYIINALNIRRRKKLMHELIETLAYQAAHAINEGHRFQVSSLVFDKEYHIKSFVVRTSNIYGENVRASVAHGVITLYADNDLDDNLSVVVASVDKNETSFKMARK